MAGSILVTKLFIPPARPDIIPRPRLIVHLDEGQHSKLTLVSAPAGFGKTTLASEWAINSDRQAGWLSLDDDDNDLARFLSYFLAAFNQIEGIDANFGKAVSSMLQSPQPPPIETMLTVLINEIAATSCRIILILDDYHLIDDQAIHHAVRFFIENLPPQIQMVIITREDPPLSLSRLRARGQLTELRAVDLRFSSTEAAEFLHQATGLNISAEDIAALENRTEGWIVGLRLAAVSMKGQEAPAQFIKSFTGSHRLVLDYLMEEVLMQQPKKIQDFLLQTAFLNRLTASLCDTVRFGEINSEKFDSQSILELLERSNLFIVPLDHERRWYRYHHLFADLLSQRLNQQQPERVAEYHIRASKWYEAHDMLGEAFQYAAAADDTERAARLAEGDGLPLHFRGVVSPLLNWLKSLPKSVLDTRPALWVIYASVLVVAGQPTGIEEKLQAAEKALEGTELNNTTRDLIALIASTRAALSAMMISGQSNSAQGKLQAAEAALQEVELDDIPKELVARIVPMQAPISVDQQQLRIMISESRRALEYAHPDNLIVRTSSFWMLGVACQLQGDLGAAYQAYAEVIANNQALGNNPLTIAATIGLGQVQEEENQLYLAEETYRRALQLVSDLPLPVACEAHLGLARINYEWNNLEAAQHHGQLSLDLARQLKNDDRSVDSEIFLACLKLAQGDLSSAAAGLAKAEQTARRKGLINLLPRIASAQVLTKLQQGNLPDAAALAQKYELPISQVRVHLAKSESEQALALLDSLSQKTEMRGWQDEQIKLRILRAAAHHMHADEDLAVKLLGDVLTLAEPAGLVRIFVDEGPPVTRLLADGLSQGLAPVYVRKLLAAFSDNLLSDGDQSKIQTGQDGLIEPLSERELDVLQLIAEGLSNQEIASKLFLAVNTVKSHTRNIYGKLGVRSRTQAVARAQEFGLLSDQQH